MSKALLLTGESFGRLTVVKSLGSHSSNGRCKIIWDCLCICGRHVEVSSNNLKSGNTRSCGCLLKDVASEIAKRYPLKRTNRDISGMTFNYLTAIRPTTRRAQSSVVWLCSCRCGNQHEVALQYLTMGSVKSCGCIRGESIVTHGASRKGKWTPEYTVWRGLMQRCHNPKSPRFKDYGARGILVCERWHDFKNFRADMGQRPIGLSIDRIDNDKGYEPENCKWSTYIEQNRNRRDNRLLTFDGQTKCISEWAEYTGLPATRIASRLHRGWAVERAITTPLK